jgi:hypothetical protein
MQSTTTLYDLHKTAYAAADALTGADAYTAESGQLAAFTAAGHDHRNYAFWKIFFVQATESIVIWKQQAAPSKIADAAANLNPTPITPTQ